MAERDFRAEIDLMKKIGYHERLGAVFIRGKITNLAFSKHLGLRDAQHSDSANFRILRKRRFAWIYAGTVRKDVV